MSKQKNMDKKSMFVFGVIFIIAILCILSLYNLFFGKRKDTSINKPTTPSGVEVVDESITKSKEQIELEKIQNMSERNRIEYYAKTFLNYIETNEYSKAYSLLNIDFRKNYFSSSEKEFEEYCKNTFPQMMDIQFTNFERNGDVYVIWITITDVINGTKDSGREFNIVVKENNYNDFELSFSKK